MREYTVYVMTNRARRPLYIGVTNDLMRRTYEHKHNVTPGYTTKYSLYRLVYFEMTNDISVAITREKQLKGWTRRKKIELVELLNPTWEDFGQKWGIE